MEMFEKRDPDQKGYIKLLSNALKTEHGELYSCGNFTILAKIVPIKEGDLEYHKKYAVVFDEQADMLITGELGLRFTGEKMFKAEILERLRENDKIKELWDPDFVVKNEKYSDYQIRDTSILEACSELINEDYIAKLIERINHNTQFLEELKKLKEDLDPSDPNFGESFLTLETAITEISDKITKLQNLLEYGGTDLLEPTE